jgi:hypothetical protein
MKKLLIAILTVFILSSANADEPVYLLCDAYFSFKFNDNPDNEFQAVSGTKSFTIFPQSKKYIFEGNSGSYKEEGDLIRWRIVLIPSDNPIVDDYILNRVSGEFTDTFGIIKDGIFEPGILFKYICKKTTALF